MSEKIIEFDTSTPIKEPPTPAPNRLTNYEYSILDEVRRDEINHALKLQELVKDSTTEGNPPIIAGYLLKLLEYSKNG